MKLFKTFTLASMVAAGSVSQDNEIIFNFEPELLTLIWGCLGKPLPWWRNCLTSWQLNWTIWQHAWEKTTTILCKKLFFYFAELLLTLIWGCLGKALPWWRIYFTRCWICCRKLTQYICRIVRKTTMTILARFFIGPSTTG